MCCSTAKKSLTSAAKIDEPAIDWQPGFLRLLPAICRQAKHHFSDLGREARGEAVQEAIVNAMLAYRRLAMLGRTDVAYSTPLAMFACRQIRDGRRVGARSNSHEVSSTCCQRRHKFTMARTEDWREQLVDHRKSSPAELAAMRLDFGQWMRTFNRRDRRLVRALARGESTGQVARLFRVTAGRVSQLRREFHRKWQRFVGEELPQPASA